MNNSATLPYRSEELEKFIPNDYPHVLEDGRIPLRIQIFNDKAVLKTVLTKPKKGVYMCNHCEILFSHFGELLDHFDEFKINRPHKCTYEDCPWKIVGFNRIRQLNRHIESVHISQREHKCHVKGCNKSFGRMDLLNRHLKSVHENKNSRFNRKLSRVSLSSSSNNTSPSTSANASPILSAAATPPSTAESLTSESTLASVASTRPSVSSSSTTAYSSSNLINLINPSSDDSGIQEDEDNNYKHSIKFLTNSD